MGERNSSPLNGGQVQLAKRYRELLVSVNDDFPEPFKTRDVRSKFDDVSNGDLLKLKQAGILKNQAVGTDEPKNWYLTRKTKRWLET